LPREYSLKILVSPHLQPSTFLPLQGGGQEDPMGLKGMG